MKRLPVVSYQSTALTPDTIEALRQLELGAVQLGGIKIHTQQGFPVPAMTWEKVGVSPGFTQLPPPLSMVPTGREVCLQLSLTEYEGDPTARKQRELELLWGLVIPLGFTPWLRYPLCQDKLDMVFHYFGPWKMLFDHLHGEGRGEHAWESVVAAAQGDVGHWRGDKEVERFVQAQLHRMGFHCGLVDGNIGPYTAQALNALGITGKPLAEVAVYLGSNPDLKAPKDDRGYGHVVIPNRSFQVEAFGAIRSVKTPHGVALTIDGPGRVLLDIGGLDENSNV